MINKLLLCSTLGILLLSNCQDKPSDQPNDQFDTKAYKAVEISFLDGKVLLPKNYQLTRPEHFRDKLVALDSLGYSYQSIQEAIHKMQLSSMDFLIFTDTADVENHILFYSAKYFSLNPTVAKQYIAMLQQRVESKWQVNGLTYNRIESKFLKTNYAKIIKVKYIQYLMRGERYHTQYLVSTKYRTFAVMMNNYDDLDLQEALTRLKLR